MWARRTGLAAVFLYLFLPMSSLLAQAPAPAQQNSPTGQTEAKPEKKEVRGYTLSRERYQRAVAFSRAWYWLYFVRFVYGVAVLLLVLRWRLGPSYRDWAERVSTHRFIQAVVFTPLMLLTLDVLRLPTRLYGHWLGLEYELSVQGWKSWFWDWTKGELLNLLFVTFLAWIFYGVIRRSPRRWWFYSWLVSLPILVFAVFVEPLVVDPLFYKFEPLEAHHPALVAEIDKVVRHGGLVIARERMYEMQASEKLKAVNAYVTGIGASKRVVVWDTTMAQETTPQILSVFGHEMGHYVLRHISKGIVFAAAGILVSLFLAHWLVREAIRRWRPRWAIRGVEDWASLPVFLLLFSVAHFIAAPIENSYSRHLEHEADIYSLEVIHGVVPNSGEVAAQAFQIEGEIDLEDPDPPAFIKFWLYSHPPLGERIVFARTYDPWSKGQSPKFVK